MTEREDTIERIERVLGLTRKNSITITIPRLTAERAVSMLKKQEPKPIVITTNAYGKKFYHCPNCNKTFYEPWELYKDYCYNCGQAVKWGD